MTQEKWRSVVGYEGLYEVSSRGNVRNAGGLTLKPACTPQGYYKVTLCKEGRRRDCRIHRLVVEAFQGPIPHGYEVNHIDGVKSHNNVGNLERCTHRQNIMRAARTGLLGNGGVCGNSWIENMVWSADSGEL